jgi:hypothetical protein
MQITLQQKIKQGLSKENYTLLLSLSSPSKIQDYLESIPFNHEDTGETYMSVNRTLRERRAHCVEGALVAYAALSLLRFKPFLISLNVTDDDYDHVITVYRKDNHFGAISKTNHSVLGWRDPVYRTVRELVMSYFHEYFLSKNGKKTMRSYSKPFYLSSSSLPWINGEEELFSLAYAIKDHPLSLVHPDIKTIPLRKATKLEQEVSHISWDTL